MTANNNLGWLKRACAGGVVKGVMHHFTIIYAIPFGMPLLTAVIGYVNKISLFWIWLGMLATFSFVSTGLLRFDEWRYRRRIEDKLVFESVIVARSIANDGIIVGLRLISLATFPIEYEITSISTKIDNIIPRKNHEPQIFTMPLQGIGWFYDGVIELIEPYQSNRQGSIEYTIRYGRKGSLKHSISGKKQINFSFDKENILLNSTWHDQA